MEKQIKTESKLIRVYKDLWCDEVDISPREFGQILEEVKFKIVDITKDFPGAKNFSVNVSYNESHRSDRCDEPGFLAIKLCYNRMETDEEFEQRKAETDKVKQKASKLLEAEKENRIVCDFKSKSSSRSLRSPTSYPFLIRLSYIKSSF